MEASLFEGDIVVTDRFMRGNRVPTSLLAKNLGLVLDTDVVDSTGYDGFFNVSLQWIPFDAPTQQRDDIELKSQLITALRDQLGLKLVSSRGSIQVVKVDEVRMPSAN